MTVRIAISNIAWDIEEDGAVADLLNEVGLDAIDIAPSKYFSDVIGATPDAIGRVKEWWQVRGIAIAGMQALLFGATGLNLFSDTDVQNKMLKHLSAVCRIGKGLGARCLVFGSPKSRDRKGLDDRQVNEMADSFFRRLGDVAAAHEVVICLEPNPAAYEANFMTTSEETAATVHRIGHPSIRMQFDAGAAAMNAENADLVLSKFGALVAHVHASEPNLLTLGEGGTDHEAIADAVRRHCPNRIVTIEMLPSKSESHLAAIRRALSLAKRVYGGTG